MLGDRRVHRIRYISRDQCDGGLLTDLDGSDDLAHDHNIDG
jgi:hypothetical protein